MLKSVLLPEDSNCPQNSCVGSGLIINRSDGEFKPCGWETGTTARMGTKSSAEVEAGGLIGRGI